MQKRTYLEDAVVLLAAEAKECKKCKRLFVYGRAGAVYCSGSCARAAAQREYRQRVADNVA